MGCQVGMVGGVGSMNRRTGQNMATSAGGGWTMPRAYYHERQLPTECAIKWHDEKETVRTADPTELGSIAGVFSRGITNSAHSQWRIQRSMPIAVGGKALLTEQWHALSVLYSTVPPRRLLPRTTTADGM